jgi:hypothetical protein
MARLRLLIVVVAALALPAGGVTSAEAAPATARLVKGLYDESQVLYGNPDETFPILKQLGTKAVRVNLYWGGRFGASLARPTGLDPDEPGKYDWGLYDRVVRYAAAFGMDVYFSIYGTPRWANAGKGLNAPPTRPKDLENFAYVAATRFNGAYVNNEGQRLPSVRRWIAWNEPNNPIFLKEQFRKVRGKWVVQSARDYAKICNAVVIGVGRADISFSAQGQAVACGVTAPRGNNRAGGGRPSVSPIPFVRAMKAAGARGFDVYAHHPYYGHPTETPSTRPKTRQSITLANIDVLIAEVTRLWGRKPIWISEYGYQTNPPDKIFGVPNRLQARYMAQAYAIAKRHPRITAFFWFLLKDDSRLAGWQSGLQTASGARKPAFSTFRSLR